MAASSDIIDQANELAERERDYAFKHVRREAGPQPIGHCLRCEEPIPKPRRWCDSSCRDQWERDSR